MHIPWFTLPPIDLSELGLGKLDWFSIFVFIAIIVGVVLYDRACARGGDIDAKVARIVPEAAVVGGFIVAHLAHVLVYHPELTREDPWVVLKVWAGISSLGGFLGAVLGLYALARYKRQPIIPYADRVIFGLSVAWIFGRLGCATSHDHPGSRTDFFLGVAYRDGVRHDLGLYELMLTVFVIVPLVLYLSRRPWRTGSLTAAFFLVYGPARFALDFLRATDRDFVDARYLGLTFAQYATALMTTAGIAIVVTARRRAWTMQPPLWGKRVGAPAAEKREAEEPARPASCA